MDPYCFGENEFLQLYINHVNELRVLLKSFDKTEIEILS